MGARTRRQGVNAGGRLDPAEVDMAFYGLLFRPAGTKGAHAIPNFAPGDLCAGFEQELLSDLYKADLPPGSAALDSKGGVARRWAVWFRPSPGRHSSEASPSRSSSGTQAGIVVRQQSSHPNRGAQGCARHHHRGHARGRRALARKRRGLGGAVPHPELPVRTLVTIGSPLGVPALLSRLEPTVTLRPGTWPPGLQRWANIADTCDVVALEKRLARVFGSRVDDSPVNNGATMHDVCPYLTSAEVGRAILGGLA